MIDPVPTETGDKEKKKERLVPVLSTNVLYCNTTMLQMSKEEVVLSFISGPGIAAEFAFSLPHLKRLHDIIGKNIKLYEDKYGITIDTNKNDVTTSEKPSGDSQKQ